MVNLCAVKNAFGSMEHLTKGGVCHFLAFTTTTQRSHKNIISYKNLKWSSSSLHICGKNLFIGLQGRCLTKGKQNLSINSALMSESGTSSDFGQEVGNSSPIILSNSNELLTWSKSSEQKNETSGRLLSIMIDGVSPENDLERLQAQLKEISGVSNVSIGPLMDGGIRGGYVVVHLQVDEAISTLSLISEVQRLDSEQLILPFKTHSWTWRGHKINYAVAGCGKPIILVHGFGGNAGHFARLFPYLTDHHRVYAIDLLGFGASEKPLDANYGPDLWAELICDFSREFTQEGAVLVGNSIGSLTVLAAAAREGSDLLRGIVLLNCAGAMNRKGLSQDDILIRLFSPVFSAVEYLLQQPRVATFLFNRFRSKDNIRKILEGQAYRNKDAVTNQLVDILYFPSSDSGAKDVFVKVFTGDPGPRPEALIEKINVPLLVLWGDSDIWTPPNGPIAKYLMQLAAERENVEVYVLPDVGHCPHDDRPELAANYILPFISSLDK